MTANRAPLSATTPNGLPRRACLDANHPAELHIRAAIDKVENLGADVLLTQAVTKLAEAQDLVADWLEGQTRS